MGRPRPTSAGDGSQRAGDSGRLGRGEGRDGRGGGGRPRSVSSSRRVTRVKMTNRMRKADREEGRRGGGGGEDGWDDKDGVRSRGWEEGGKGGGARYLQDSRHASPEWRTDRQPPCDKDTASGPMETASAAPSGEGEAGGREGGGAPEAAAPARAPHPVGNEQQLTVAQVQRLEDFMVRERMGVVEGGKSASSGVKRAARGRGRVWGGSVRVLHTRKSPLNVFRPRNLNETSMAEAGGGGVGEGGGGGGGGVGFSRGRTSMAEAGARAHVRGWVTVAAEMRVYLRRRDSPRRPSCLFAHNKRAWKRGGLTPQNRAASQIRAERYLSTAKSHWSLSSHRGAWRRWRGRGSST